MMPRIAKVVYRTFAHEKATRLLAQALTGAGYEVEAVSLYGVEEATQVANALVGAQLLVLSCGGKDINQIMDVLHGRGSCAVTLALFPGIVVPDQLEAFVSRVRCTLTLLNDERDARLYRRVCKALGLPDNGVVYGASWWEGAGRREAAQSVAALRRAVVFFEQADVPGGADERHRLAELLIALAERFPARTFFVKSRHAGHENLDGGRECLPLAALLRSKTAMPNMQITDLDVAALLEMCDACMTVSSSAAVEGLLAGKRVYILADFASRRNYTSYFRHSGLITRARRIDFNRGGRPRPAWRRARVRNPETTLASLLCRIGEPATGIRRVSVKWPLLRLVLGFPWLSLRCGRPFVRRLRVTLKRVMHEQAA